MGLPRTLAAACPQSEKRTPGGSRPRMRRAQRERGGRAAQVAAKEAELGAAVAEERELLLLAFRLFRDVLTAGHAELDAARAAAAAAAAAAASAAADAAMAAAGEPAAEVADGSGGGGGGTGAAAAAAAAETEAERAAWFAFTAMSLRAFARRYCAAAAPLAARLEADIFAGPAVPAEVRAAVHEGLHF